MKMNLFVAFLFGSWLVLAAMAARIFREPIEESLTVSARSALDAAGLAKVGVSFDHLDATLTGNVESRELKVRAAETVEALDGARVVNNHITFGSPRSPRLSLISGDPIRVEGVLDQQERLSGFGDGFDTTGVRIADAAPPWWIDGLMPLAEGFFSKVVGGKMEFDGRMVVLEGVIDTGVAKQQLLDQLDAMGEGVDIIDRLSVRELAPFSVSIVPGEEGLVITGTVDDELLHEVFASLASDSDQFVMNSRAASPAWLYEIPRATARLFDIGILPSISASSEGLVASGIFPDEFWRDAAERSLRKQMPSHVNLELDFQVARKAVVESAGDEADAQKKIDHLLPIKIEIADQYVRLSGTVRTMDERKLIVEKVAESRSDIEVVNELRYDYKQSRIPAVRAVLPDVIGYVIASIDDYGVVDLDGEIWRVRASSQDSKKLLEASQWLKRLEGFGFAVESDLTVVGSSEPHGMLMAFEENQIYFKSGSAQISKLQTWKIESLTEAIRSSGSGMKIGIIGLDEKGRELGMQRARAVRRALMDSGIPLESLSIRSAKPARPIDWRSERAYLEIVELESIPESE